MHVAIVSDLETEGGAAIAASRLAQGLLDAGVEVTRIVALPDGKRHPWRTVGVGFRHRQVVAVDLLTPGGYTDLPLAHVALRRLDQALQRTRPDVVNLHNLHAAASMGWSPRVLEVARRHAPVVWTLHDMWSFTGRCAYNGDCRRFESLCTPQCPTPHQYPPLPPRRIPHAFVRRRAILAGHADVVAVSPSRWLASEAASGLWRDHRVEVVPNGLDLSVFRPIDRRAAREALGIDSDNGPVLVAAAQELDDPRKGMNLLDGALSHIGSRQVTLVLFGSGRIEMDAPNVTVVGLGPVSSDRIKAAIYSAADVFLHPACQDNLPLVVQEAISCGTPVVAFPVGGLPDLVRDGATGWLADEQSPESFGQTIDRALAAVAENPLRRELPT